VNLLPSEEQLAIVEAAGSFLAKQLPSERRRGLHSATSSIDADVWSHCAELGWFSLGVDEQRGGVGYGLAEEALLFMELGQQLAPGPFLSTVLGARVAVAAGSDDVASAIIEGKAPVGLATGRPDSSTSPTITGSFDVLDAVGARYVLVADPVGASLVDTDALESREVVPCIDEGVRLETAVVHEPRCAAYVPATHEPIWLRGTVLAAAMLVGISEATRDLASEYAKVRVQFGKPIGVNQAIKHRCADMAMRSAAARSQVCFAAITVDERRPDETFQATAAKVVATDAALENAGECIQVHGGIGYTYEHDANLYLKRAHVLDRALGDRRHHLGILADLPSAQ
jgi:alkylation response protein AidB-like acyl-CoA dehydrogenase